MKFYNEQSKKLAETYSPISGIEREYETHDEYSVAEVNSNNRSEDFGQRFLSAENHSEGATNNASKDAGDSSTHGGGKSRDPESLHAENAADPTQASTPESSDDPLWVEALKGPRQNVSAASSTNTPTERLSLYNPSWAVELSEKIGDLNHQKRQYLTLEIEPEQLGKIVLKVEANQDQVSAWVSTSSEQVKSLLAQNLPILRQHLQEQGLSLSQFFVDVSSSKDGRQSNQQQPSSSRRRNEDNSKARGVEPSDIAVGRKIRRSAVGEQIISVFA